MIYAERIRFRAVERSDLPAFLGWVNDPEIRTGIGIYLPYSMADEEKWFDEMLTHPLDEHNFAIEVRLPAGDPGVGNPPPDATDPWKLIGSCGFFGLDRRNRSSEFGIMIGDKNYWDKGYGTEAVRLLCQHGFQTLNLHRIYLRVFETNPRAIRAYEKVGFTHEGRQRQAEFRDGKYIDVIVMSILSSEF